MSMNTVRVGLARLVITTIRPICSTMKIRFVSPGADTIATGAVKVMFPKALALE